MNGRDWQIGRVLGIPIRIHASWLLVFGFVTWTLATGYLPESLPGLSIARYWAMGLVATVLLFASVLLHELGHSYVALRYRMPIAQITLFIFGGVAQIRREPPGPRAELLIAIAGPAVSFAIGGALLLFTTMLEASASLQGLVALGTLVGTVNVQLGLFNLIPGFPLDGGRVLRAGLWRWSGDFNRATQQAAFAGQVFGLVLGALGAMLLAGAAARVIPGAAGVNGGWIVLIGAFLFAAAASSRRQAMLRASLSRVSVADVMVQDVVTLPPDLSVEQAVADFFIRYGHSGFPVQADGRIVGMLTVREIQQVPQPMWVWRRVRDLMQPWSPTLEVAPESPAMAALEQMVREGQGRLGVMQNGRLVGLVTRSGIVRYLQLRGMRP
jgi:Zn-dependent protease